MDKTVIITGSKGNLGKASVEVFSKNNWQIIPTVNLHSQNINSEKSSTANFAVDLTDEKSVLAFFEMALSEYKTIDAVLLLVGGYASGDLGGTDKGIIEKMMALNFYSAYNLARLVIKQMLIQNSGTIILVGSGPATNPLAAINNVAYAFSKSLLYRLAEVLNLGGEMNNVKTYVIVPSTIDTLQNRKAMPDADFTKWQKAEFIAEKMFELVSSESNQNSIIEM